MIDFWNINKNKARMMMEKNNISSFFLFFVFIADEEI